MYRIIIDLTIEFVKAAKEITDLLFDNAVADVIITEINEEYEKGRRLVIQKLNGSSSDVIDLSALNRDISNTTVQILDSTSDDSDVVLESSRLMMFESHQEFDERIEREIVHWLPFHVSMVKIYFFTYILACIYAYLLINFRLFRQFYWLPYRGTHPNQIYFKRRKPFLDYCATFTMIFTTKVCRTRRIWHCPIVS